MALVGAVALLVGGGGRLSDATASAIDTAQRASVVPLGAVIDAPTKVADTAAGAVGYREVGTGTPIVLLMGLGGSMCDWDPASVASLAVGRNIVMFGNAGVGQTRSLTSPLNITEMARQASALISTLGLGRVAVLGWSMGGMVAQALAVLHPTQVSKIVLAATQPRHGTRGSDTPGRRREGGKR
jgi:pimeloyl-ACP methyl ester carboxylesterase